MLLGPQPIYQHKSLLTYLLTPRDTDLLTYLPPEIDLQGDHTIRRAHAQRSRYTHTVTDPRAAQTVRERRGERALAARCARAHGHAPKPGDAGQVAVR